MTNQGKNDKSATVVSDENHEEKIDKERKARKAKNIPKLLMYAAASLSFISFLTTAEGMTTVLGETDQWKAYFISFGIQSIVLVLGTSFLKVMEVIKVVYNRLYQLLIGGLIVALYISSIGFSAFFSYVFLANHAYNDVKTIDYNIEIEQFLVSETKHLKDINDVSGRAILRQIQKDIPTFNSSIGNINTNASMKVKKIIEGAGLVKYENGSIDNSSFFDANAIRDKNPEIYEEQKNVIYDYERKINAIENNYNNSYERYCSLYDATIDKNNIAKDVNPKIADSRINSINNEIKMLNEQIALLKGIKDNSRTIERTLNSARNTLQAMFQSLIASYGQLKTVYEDIKNANLSTNANISLQRVNRLLYSDEAMTEEDINEAIEDIQNIITGLLNTDETYSGDNNETIKKLADCVTYLNEYRKYKMLNKRLNDFESNNLDKVYVIVVSQTDVSSSDSQIKVTSEEWTKIRREDMALFIRLVKTLPDVDLLLKTMKDDASANLDQLVSNNTSEELKENKFDADEILAKAYELNRRTLENINDVERAELFLKSEYKYMAHFSLWIAVFMDVASLLIGFYIYLVGKKEDTES